MSNPVVPSGTGIPPQNYGNPVPGNFYVGQWTWYGSPHNNWYWAGNGPVGWIGGPYSFTQVPKPTKDPYGNPIQPPATTSPPTPAPVPPPPPPPPAAGVPPTETPPAPPSASAPPPPEEGCGQPLAVAVGPVQDMLGGKKFDEQMAAPVVGHFQCLPVHSRDRWVNSATNANQFVLYDDPPYVKKDTFGRYTSVHSGYGDGVVAFSPPQLFDHHLYGDGYLLDSLWPKTISEPTLLLVNGNRANSLHGDHARSYLAFGLPLPTTNKPKSGVYFEYDPSTGVLNIQHTDSTGGDTTVANGVTIDGSPIGSGSVTFPLEAPDNATGAQYAFDAGTVVGSDLAGMGFDQNVQEGPAFYDINGDNQLYITSAGVTIPGKLTVTGLIDPTGLELTPVAANPGGVAANTLWLDSTASNVLKWGADYLLKGSLGTTDNVVPRTDGTGGNALQGSALVVNDVSGGSLIITADGTVTGTLALRPADTLAVSTGPGLSLDAAQGSATPGTVDIGKTNAEAVAIGRTGKNTTIRGSGRVNQMAHFVGAFAGAAGNDVAVGAVSCFRVTSGTTLTGMVPAAGGTAVDGQLMVVVNETGSDLTLSHDVTSAAANRLFMAGGANLTLSRYNAALFRYSTSDSRWRHVGEAGGGSGASDFTDLTDVPASYSGAASKVVTVKSAEDGLEFSSSLTGLGSIGFATLQPTEASPPQITSNQTAYILPTATLIRLSTDESRDIVSMAVPSSSISTMVLITNVGGFDIVFKNQDTSDATASQRIITGLGGDYTLGPDQSVWAWYDKTTLRWRLK